MGPLHDLVSAGGFQTGLWTGGLAAIVVLSATALPRRRAVRGGRPRPRPPVAGILFAAASLAALAGVGPWAQTAQLPRDLWWGIGLLWVGAELGERVRPGMPARAVGAVPGAVVVAYGAAVPGEPWVRVMLAVVTTLGAALAADLDDRAGRLGLGPLLFGVSVFAAYTTVPDTEMARVLVGTAAPLAVLGVAGAWVRLGAGGAAAAFGVLAWVVAFEGAPRPGSIVGALGALGLLLTEPVGHRLRPRAERVLRVRPSRAVLLGVAFGAHAVLAAYAARVAGFEAAAGAAAGLLTPVVLAGVLLGAGVDLDVRVHRQRYRYRSRRSETTTPGRGRSAPLNAPARSSAG